MTGYGINNYWIQEYETLIGRKLKVFEIADPALIDLFEVMDILIKQDEVLRGSDCTT